MFVEAVILGLAIGIARKGRISNLASIRIRGWFMILFAIILQLMLFFKDALPIIGKYSRNIYIASAILILLTIIFNLNKKGMWLILIGALLNFIVMMLNGFQMPIHFEGLRLAGLEKMIEGIKAGDIINYMALENINNWTRYLAKFIVIPKPYPLAKVISIGDIVMSLGIILFIQGEMAKSYLTARGRMIRMGYKTRF